VRRGREGERTDQELAVDVVVVLRGGREQFVDEVLVLLGDIDDGHWLQCRRGFLL
jgi:hypothetical protein